MGGWRRPASEDQIRQEIERMKLHDGHWRPVADGVASGAVDGPQDLLEFLVGVCSPGRGGGASHGKGV
jgi:hypothetical protein